MTEKTLFTKNKQYLAPKEFHEEYSKCLEANKCSNKLILMFEKIAKKYSTTFGGKNKCDRDACVNYAMMEAYKKWKKYDINRSNNIFAFFTEMIKNDMMQHYKKLWKHKDVNISIDAIFTNTK